MAVDVLKNWPDAALEDSIEVTDGEGIVAGMMVKRDATSGKLVKADNTAGEFAMIALNNQPGQGEIFDQGNKIAVIKGNASVGTDQYIVHAYEFHEKLMVSDQGGEEGMIKEHDAQAATPVVGRFLRFDTNTKGDTLMYFDLVRE